MKKFLKVILTLSTAFIFILTVWFLSKPLRMTKAVQYLDSGTLLNYRKALLLNPRSPLVHLKIGQAEQEKGNFREAEKEYRKIVKLCQTCPEYKTAYLNLAKIKTKEALEKGNASEAEAGIAQAIELGLIDPEISFYWAFVLISQGNYEEAKNNLELKMPNEELEKQKEALLSTLKKINPLTTNPYALVLVGTTFFNLGYENLAIGQFEKAVKADPEYRDGWLYLGRVYLEQSQFAQAKEVLEKAAQVDPIEPKTFQLLAQIYEKLGKPDEAQKAAEKAKMLGI